jgi:hypothetical protein
MADGAGRLYAPRAAHVGRAVITRPKQHTERTHPALSPMLPATPRRMASSNPVACADFRSPLPDRNMVGQEAVRVGEPAGGPDRSGRWPHPKFLGQLADLRRRVAAVPAKRLQERQFAFLSPTGDGLGRHVQDVGHLGGLEVAGKVRCGLAAALGCHGASPFVRRTRMPCRVRSGPGVRPATKGEGGTATMLAVALLRAGLTGRLCRPIQLPAIVRLGRFSGAAT